jgi:phosphatidylglycerophosphate synthase
MIDRYLYPPLARLLRPAAAALGRIGVTADQITVAGFLIGLCALPLLAAGLFTAALLAILLNRAADGLDGAVARATAPTDRGAFLDIALDFFFYATVPLGFALTDPSRNALPAAVLITAFVGTGSSFLAFSVIAGKRGLQPDAYPTKGLFYLGGLTEGFETIAVFCLMALFPAAFPILALIFAAACLLTTATRWVAGWRSFTDTP